MMFQPGMSLLVLTLVGFTLSMDGGSTNSDAGETPTYDARFGNQSVQGEVHHETVANTAAADKDAINAQLASSGLKIAAVDWCRTGTSLPSGGVCSWVEDGIVYQETVGARLFSVEIERDPYEELAVSPQPLIVTWSDVFTLPIQSGTVEPQLRDDGTHLIQVELPTQSTATEHILTATLLDTPVEIRLTPVQWDWDFGEEVPGLTTRTPGGHWPDLTVAPIYEHVAEGLTINTTITWTGEYRIGDLPTWFPISGHGTTTATSAPFSTYEYRTYLIHDPNQPDPSWAEDR